MKKSGYFISALIFLAATPMSLPTSVFAADNAAIKAMEEFLDFSEYGGATTPARADTGRGLEEYLCDRHTRRRSSTRFPTFPAL